MINVLSHLLGNLVQGQQTAPVLEPEPWFLRSPAPKPKPFLRPVPPPPVPTPNPPSFWKGVFQGLGRFVGWGATIIFAVGDSTPHYYSNTKAPATDANTENWQHVSECVGGGSPVEDCFLDLPHPDIWGRQDREIAIHTKQFVDNVGDLLTDKAEDVLKGVEEAWAEYLERIRREQNDDPAPRETAISIGQPTAETKQIASGSPKIVASIGSSSTVASPSPSTTRVAPPETDDDDDLGANLDKVEDAIWLLHRVAKKAGIGNEINIILAALEVRKDETIQARFDRIAETLKGEHVVSLISRLTVIWEKEVFTCSADLTRTMILLKSGRINEQVARSKVDELKSRISVLMDSLQDFKITDPLTATYSLIGVSPSAAPISTLRAAIHDVRNRVSPLNIRLEKGIKLAETNADVLEEVAMQDFATANRLVSTVMAICHDNASLMHVVLSYVPLFSDNAIPEHLQVPLFLLISEAVTNGVKYRDKNKLNREVTVILRSDDVGILTVMISDNGIGMTPEQIDGAEHGNARFAKDLADGTGQGFGDIKSTCDKHEWEHHFTSTPNKGSTHTIQIDTSHWIKVMH